jgi:hypothetical protein
MHVTRAVGPVVPTAGPERSLFKAVLDGTVPHARLPPPPVHGAGGQLAGAVQSFAQRISEAQHQLDAVLQQARAGRAFSPAELLGLQVRVCQASQVIDLAGKAVDKAVGSVKQVLQTPV